MSRAQEFARFVDRLSDKGKTAAEDKLKAALRSLDESYLVQGMPESDQKVMKDNEALRGQVQPEEYSLVFLTNQYRVMLGKNALRLNLKLCEASRDHSKDMKEKNFFDHVSPVPGKQEFWDRAKRHGAKALSENIYQGVSTGEEVFWGWFRSFLHHQGMLDRSGVMGVGTYQGFWTELFGE